MKTAICYLVALARSDYTRILFVGANSPGVLLFVLSIFIKTDCVLRKKRITLRNMRKIIEHLFPKTRASILELIILHPDRTWSLSELARSLGVPPSSLQREIDKLEKVGILLKRKDNNRVLVTVNHLSPIFPELTGLLIKTGGITNVIKKLLRPHLKQISVAFCYGSFARGELGNQSDIDLMLIGSVGLSDIARNIKRAQNKLSREVNPTVLTEDELRAKIKQKNNFFTTILREPKIFLIGNNDELEKIKAAQ